MKAFPHSLKRTALMLVMLVCGLLMAAAQSMPVHFTTKQRQVSPTEVEVVFTASIDAGWHVYSTNLPEGGPNSTELTTEKAEGAQPVGKLTARGKEIAVDDPVFEMRLRYFEGSVTFVQRYKITGKTYHIKGYLEYSACNAGMCMPPAEVEFDFQGKGAEEAASKAALSEKSDKSEKSDLSDLSDLSEKSEKSDQSDSSEKSDLSEKPTQATMVTDLWAPCAKELQALSGSEGTDHSLLYIFIIGFLGGLVALFTPCVWPIIPMTVSFFLKRTKDKAKGIRDAVTYGISIVVIYLALAGIITAVFGPQKLNELATNAPFNIFFFLLLVVFALSFFGWFELRLPSSWGNKVDTKASTTSGLLSIFLMAFTLSLVSFSCTAPVVGLLLVEAATSGNWVAPAAGMLGFALALALPFTLFALFPSWLKQAPKSGSWMNTIKVSLGFVELAFALKFFSVADLAYGWGLLDREVFLSLWIVIFALLGLYLLGKLHFQSDGEERKAQPVLCIMLGLVSLAFAVYMVPGLWGAPCKAVSAFAPPMTTQDFNLYRAEEVRPAFTDYEEGMAYAKAQGKPVVLDFTGFGCVNCRKMEAAVWTDRDVAERLTKDYVLISLYVDDKTPLPEPLTVKTADGTTRKLRTVGDKWSYLQQTKFGYLAQPFYVTLDNQGKPLSGSFVYQEDIPAYLDFLDRGISNYKKK